MPPRILRAISIRQPYAELILQGKKVAEYRSIATQVRGRVYIYASATPADDPASWKKSKFSPGDLPAGCIVGSVEVTGCRYIPSGDYYAYELAHPRRLRRPRRPVNQPQPIRWRPVFR